MTNMYIFDTREKKNDHIKAYFEKHGIPFKVIHITDKESAQNVPTPVTTYALFRDGRFLTQSIQSDKKFLTLAGL